MLAPNPRYRLVSPLSCPAALTTALAQWTHLHSESETVRRSLVPGRRPPAVPLQPGLDHVLPVHISQLQLATALYLRIDRDPGCHPGDTSGYALLR